MLIVVSIPFIAATDEVQAAEATRSWVRVATRESVAESSDSEYYGYDYSYETGTNEAEQPVVRLIQGFKWK